jgi:hypothetical protein
MVSEGRDSHELVTDSLPANLPTKQVRSIVSVLIVIHLAALVITLAANLAPSYLQGRLTDALAPYLRTTSQFYEAFPIELTHAESIDFPLLVEFHETGEPPSQWRRADLPGVLASANGSIDVRGSRWPNLSRLIRLLAEDQPESEILADLLARFVVSEELTSHQPLDGARFIAPHVFSFDDDLLAAAGQGSLVQGEWKPEIIYQARIVRGAEGRILLVPEQESMRTAKPMPQGVAVP